MKMEVIDNKGKSKAASLINAASATQSYVRYAVSSILMLYLCADTSQGGLGIGVAKAASVVGFYQGINYIGPVLGGYITDRWLGIQKSLTIGAFLSAIGYLLLFLARHTLGSIWLGLGIVTAASAFFRGQISSLVGLLYKSTEEEKKDNAYRVFYMFANIGSFLGPIVAGILSDKWLRSTTKEGGKIIYGYSYIFLMVAIIMFLLGIAIRCLAHRVLGEIGRYPSAREWGYQKKAKGISALTVIEKKHMLAMGIVFFFVIAFWSAWNQTATSIPVLADKYVTRTVFRFTIPVPWLISFNGILCIGLSPLLARIWSGYTAPMKMGVGLVSTGLSFVCLAMGVNSLGGNMSGSSKMSLCWVLGAYVLLTIGELCISPVGMAMFHKLAPPKYGSRAMGIWYLSYFFANMIAGRLAGMTENMGYVTVFYWIAGVVLVMGILLIGLRRYIFKLMVQEGQDA